jgi:hypothetical protein
MQTIRPRSYALPVLIALLSLSGCASIGPLNPTAPEAKASVVAPPVIPDSVIQIPLHVDLRPLAAAINTQVPPGDDSGWTDTGKRIFGTSLWIHTAWNRGPILIGAAADQLTVRTTIAYKAQVGAGGSHKQVAECGWEEAPPTLGVGLDVSLTPQADWSMTPDVTVPDAVVGTRCQLTKLDIDVSNRIADALHKKFADTAANFQKQLAEKLDFRTQGQSAWEALTKPYVLSAKDGSYMLLHPSHTSLSPLVADKDGNGVSIVVGLVIHPEIGTGMPPVASAAPLPPLQRGKSDDGLVRVALPVQVTYAALNASLNQKYAGKTYPIGGNPETIDHLTVYGSGQDLVIAVKLHGKADGTVYLAGVPAYDPATHNLYMDKLDYTLDTKNIVAKSAGWLLHGELRDMLQSKARFDLSAKVAAVRETATQALNRPMGGQSQLSGAITDIRPQAFMLSDTDITAYMVAEGTVKLSLQ